MKNKKTKPHRAAKKKTIAKHHKPPKPSTGRGGKREGAGRKPRSLNKTTVEAKLFAQSVVNYQRVLERMENEVCTGRWNHLKLTTAEVLLDRGFGLPQRIVDVTSGDKPVAQVFVVPGFNTSPVPDAPKPVPAKH